jgi:RND family efflux transporter MFP subunit
MSASSPRQPVVPLFLGAAALVCGACSSARSAESAGARPLVVRTATVEKRDLPEDLLLSGTLAPRAEIQVVAEVAARLLRVERDVGARVREGERLAVLDDTDYRLAHDRARAALAVAEASHAHARTEKERADSLLKTGGITDRDHLAAQVALRVAEASLAHGNAELAIAARQLARTEVKAPFAGRVARRYPDPGSMLAAGSPLFTLVDDAVMEFEAQVASRDLAKVRIGAPALLSIDALPGDCIDGTVARTEPLVDERSRSFRAVIAVPGGPGLVGGLFGRASVRVGVIQGALVVPPAALVRDGADARAASAFVVRQGKAEKVALGLGAEAPDGIQVSRGLAAGDVIVLDPPAALSSGAPVDVRNGGRGVPKPSAP